MYLAVGIPAQINVQVLVDLSKIAILSSIEKPAHNLMLNVVGPMVVSASMQRYTHVAQAYQCLLARMLYIPACGPNNQTTAYQWKIQKNAHQK